MLLPLCGPLKIHAARVTAGSDREFTLPQLAAFIFRGDGRERSLYVTGLCRRNINLTTCTFGGEMYELLLPGVRRTFALDSGVWGSYGEDCFGGYCFGLLMMTIGRIRTKPGVIRRHELCPQSSASVQRVPCLERCELSDDLSFRATVN